MSELKEMYPAAVNSKATTILGALDPDTTEITVLDAAVLPEAPNLLVIGSDNTAETVKLVAKDGNQLTVERGFQGTAKTWKAGALIARNFTAYDYDSARENIEAVNDEVGELAENQNGVKHYNDFIDISLSFNATTPIVTLFQAMVPNSILDCAINQANSVYPSAQGSLHLIKLTETTGRADFFDKNGILFTINPIDKVLKWRKFLDDEETAITLPLLAGFSLIDGFVVKNSANQVTINALIYKDDDFFVKNTFTKIAVLPAQWIPNMEIFGQGNFQASTSSRIIFTNVVSVNDKGIIYVNTDVDNMNRVSFNITYKAVK